MLILLLGITRTFKKVSRRAPADFCVPQQLRRDQFDGVPVILIREIVFRFGEQSAFELLGAAITGPLHGQFVHDLLIACGPLPGVVPRETRLSRDAAQGDENLAFQPILRRPKYRFAELAQTETFIVRHNADARDRPVQDQRQHRMTGFMVSGGFKAGGWFHDFIIQGMADPRLKEMMDPAKPIFDFKRMAYGGFRELVHA